MLYYYGKNVGGLEFTVFERDGKIAAVNFGEINAPKIKSEGAENKETPVISEAYKQLTEYFAGTRREFDLPLAPEGTSFQKACWDALLKIPYGQTRSYRALAESVSRPKAARAAGGANNKNPIAIIIPCHRVIGAGGKLVGYAAGLEIKKRLLDLEQGKGKE